MELGAGAERKVHREMTDGAKLCREEKERTAVSSGSGHIRVTVIAEIVTSVS